MTLSLRPLIGSAMAGPALLSRTRCLLARHGHGGIRQAEKNIERLALLEQALDKPTRERAAESAHDPAHATTSTDTAAFLRSLPDRVAEVRQQQHRPQQAPPAAAGPTVARGQAAGRGFGSPRGAPQEDEAILAEHDVVSLAHFLASCKQYRLDVGGARQADERRRRRQRYRDFWDHNIGSAVRCCQPTGGHDFSFLALHGLADDQLHMDFAAMTETLRVLETERPISSCMDMTRSLQYLARELSWMEKQRRNPTSGSASSSSSSGRAEPRRHAGSAAGDFTETTTTLPSQDALRHFRAALTDLAMERISFFFLENAPTRSSGLPQGGGAAATAPAFSSGALLGNSEDALSALEVLAVLNVRDIRPAVAESLAARITAAEHAQYERHRQFILDNIDPLSVLNQDPDAPPQPASSSSPSVSRDLLPSMPPQPSPVTSLTQWAMVSRTFYFAVHAQRQLNFTDVVQGFALLRIFLPILWPPYGPRHEKTSNTNRTSPASPSTSAPSATTPPSSAPQRTVANLGDEKDALQRICWGLAVALKRRDQHFTNPYHFVKIVTSLAKLPSFVLSPPPQSNTAQGKRRPRHTSSAESADVATTSGHASKPVAWTAEAFWSFMVAKACIFVPNLPLDQRRLVCRGLDLAIREKRGRLLGATTSSTTAAQQASPAGSALVDLQGTSDDILLPLVEDMAALEENFDVAVRRARETGGSGGSGGGGGRGRGASQAQASSSPRHPHDRQPPPPRRKRSTWQSKPM